MKNHLMISSFYKSVPKIMNRWCTVPEIECMTDLIAISHLDYFFILLPPSDPKNQNFEKRKNLSGDIIILHMCTRNYDQMMYSSWDIVRDGCNYFSFWAIFCPFTLLTAQKIKIKKKQKKAWRHHHFTYVHQKL